MILDSINQFSDYENLHPLFPKALEFIQSLDFNNLQLEKKEIAGKDLFVTISDSNLKSKEDAKLEAHNEYIDIQIPVSKAETFGWAPRKELKSESAPFDQTKDLIFYNDIPTTYITVQPLNFVIFYPEDAHAPCIGLDTVCKIVIKVKVKP